MEYKYRKVYIQGWILNLLRAPLLYALLNNGYDIRIYYLYRFIR